MEHELRLTDLVDIETLQRLQDAFSKMTGIAALTTDCDGVPVTKGSNFSDFCMHYTRKSALGCARCEKCDKYGAQLALKEGRSITYFCHAGLMDFAAPIMADGHLVGCFIGGQVLTELPPPEKVRTLAASLDIDPEEYVAAANKVTILPQETIEKSAEFLYNIAGVISDIAYNRYLSYKASQEMERAARMKSDFLANMSHEIRTPMNAIIGIAELALRENLNEVTREYLNEIKASGRSLLAIINDILDFSKIESGKLNIVPVEYEPLSIIHDIANIVMTQTKDRDVEFLLDVAPDIPYKLFGDNDRIKQIILNLTSNAMKFTRHGKVLLSMDYEDGPDGEIVLKVSVRDSGIGIKKEDLPKLFRSFEQLDSKRNRNIEGTGLGLAISKQLLTLMHGQIHVESEYEKGSTFSFSLPQKVIDKKPSVSLHEASQIRAAGLIQNDFVRESLSDCVKKLGASYLPLTSEQELPLLYENSVSFLFVEEAHLSDSLLEFIRENPQFTAIVLSNEWGSIHENLPNVRYLKKPVYTLNISKVFKGESLHYQSSEQSSDYLDFIAPSAHVLIVDDNAINLTVAKGLLEPLQMKIDTAASGKEAIDLISKCRYDLLFMDHMMPELDGVETTHIIRRFHKEYDNVPIIALTANAVDGVMELFLREGMNDLVAKPIELKILISKVRRWLPSELVLKKTTEDNPESTEKTVLPQIGDLDVGYAFSLLGSEKLFWSVLKDYYRVIEQKAATIRRLKSEENWGAYTIEVHALKSASRQIGARDLSEKAAALEKAGNEGNTALILEKTDAMLEKYLSYVPVLRSCFSDPLPAPKKKQPLAPDTLPAVFTALREALDNLDADAMEEACACIENYELDADQQIFFRKLQDAVNNLDIDTCETVMQEWETSHFILAI